MLEQVSEKTRSGLERLSILAKRSGAIFTVVTGPTFAAIAWVHRTDHPILDIPSQMVDNHFLFFQIGLPVILGISAAHLMVIYDTSWKWWTESGTANSSAGDESDEDDHRYSIHQIEKLRWHELSLQTRQRLYAQFFTLEPKAVAPVTMVAPPDVQLSAQERSPIPLDYADKIAASFGVELEPVAYPFDDDDLERLAASREAIMNDIRSRMELPLNKQLRTVLQELYDYLPCTEHQLSSTERRDVDCVLVTAARWSLQQRVDQAIAQFKLSGCDLVLAGGRPSYDESEQPPVAEAEIMYHYLCSREPEVEGSAHIHLETRSTSSFESLQLASPILTRIARNRSDRLHLALITSTYHMRRLHLQASHLYAHQSSISVISSLTVPAAVDFGRIAKEEGPLTGRALTIIQTFLSEYFKLIGGRAVGEF